MSYKSTHFFESYSLLVFRRRYESTKPIITRTVDYYTRPKHRPMPAWTVPKYKMILYFVYAISILDSRHFVPSVSSRGDKRRHDTARLQWVLGQHPRPQRIQTIHPLLVLTFRCFRDKIRTFLGFSLRWCIELVT